MSFESIAPALWRRPRGFAPGRSGTSGQVPREPSCLARMDRVRRRARARRRAPESVAGRPANAVGGKEARALSHGPIRGQGSMSAALPGNGASWERRVLRRLVSRRPMGRQDRRGSMRARRPRSQDAPIPGSAVPGTFAALVRPSGLTRANRFRNVKRRWKGGWRAPIRSPRPDPFPRAASALPDHESSRTHAFSRPAAAAPGRGCRAAPRAALAARSLRVQPLEGGEPRTTTAAAGLRTASAAA